MSSTTDCMVILTPKDGESTYFHDFISFDFHKDRYDCFSVASGKFIADSIPENIQEIHCYVNGYEVHHGLVDKLEKTYEKGMNVISFSSRSFSVLLSQNEPVPGINPNMTLSTLGSINTSIPYVTYQTNTATVNYIYVKEHSTIWDAITAYGMKAYRILPYISGTNMVRSTPLNKASRNYNSEMIVSTGESFDTRSMVSTFYMADADGTYTNIYNNSPADNFKITRRKYYALDDQWLSNPQLGLMGKAFLSNRRYNQKFFTYLGYNGEDIYDKLTINKNGLSLSGRAVATIDISVRNGMIYTRLAINLDGNI